MPYKDPAKRTAVKRKWRLEHPDLAMAITRAWQAKNKDKVLAAVRRWRANHPDKVSEYNKKYASENRDKTRARKLLRRARKSDTISNLTRDQEKEILASGCFICGTHDNLSIAHDIPVSKGGNTTRANTFCLCRKHNSKMYTKTLNDILEQQSLPHL